MDKAFMPPGRAAAGSARIEENCQDLRLRLDSCRQHEGRPSEDVSVVHLGAPARMRGLDDLRMGVVLRVT